MLLAEFVKDFGIKKYFRTTNNIKYSLLSNFIQLVLEGDWIGRLDIPKDFSQNNDIGKYFTQLNTATAQLRFGDVYIVLSSARYRYGVYLDDETVIEQPNHLDPQHKIIKYNVAENTAALENRGYTVIWLRPLNEKNIFPPYMLGANSYVIPTVAAMKAINLPIGMVVTTSGYYNVDDGAGAKYMIVSGPFTVDDGSYHLLNNGKYAKLIVDDETVSVKVFGAKGDGIKDDTASFVAAQNFCSATRYTLSIPKGDFLISSELSFPSYYQIVGTGYGSNIVLNLPAGKYAFVNYSTTVYSIAWSFGNLRFTIKPGASTDVGAINLESSLRGGKIHDILTYGLEQPIYLGKHVYSNLKLNSIRLFNFGAGIPLSPRTALIAKGNTTFMDDIEILGKWELGLHYVGSSSGYDDGSVGSLTNFNIAGASTGSQMRRPIRFENAHYMTISNGWIEQTDDNFWANGAAESIYLKDCTHIDVHNILFSSGSLYVDGGSRNNVHSLRYAQANGGLRHLNNAQFTLLSNAIKEQHPEFGAGQAYQIDVRRENDGGVSNNPLLLTGSPTIISPTNAAFVTIVDNTSDYETGNRSLEVRNIPAPGQGALISASVIPNKTYTVAIRVKIIEGVTDVILQPYTNTPGVYNQLMNTKTNLINTWSTLFMSCKPTTSTLNFRLLVRGVTTSSKVLIDSAQIWSGINHLSPHLIGE